MQNLSEKKKKHMKRLEIGFNSLIRVRQYLIRLYPVGIGFLICLYILARPQIITAQAPIVSGQADKIYEQNNQAVVIIITYDKDVKPLGKGSGFIVRSDGAIVTNLHVVSGASSIKVKIAKDKYLEVEGLLYSDAANDLVILKAKGNDLPILTLGDSDKIKPGEKVYVIGSPEGLENSIITDGVINGRQEVGWDQKGIQISAPISDGNSGSPVFNEKGQVIGVATSMGGMQNINNFAVPIIIIKDKISGKEITSIEKFAEDFSTSAQYWFFQGYNLDRNENHKEAIKFYKEAIRIKPDFAQAHDNLGIIYGKSGDYQKAIESFKQAIRIKPDLAQAHYNLGLAYRESGNYPKAIESFKQAIRIEPDFTDAHYNLGIVSGMSGDYPKAIESLKQVIRITPDLTEAHYWLGRAYLQAGNRDRALEEYNILKELDKELANKLFTLIDKK
ncbi:MAG: tetratricopeptide repeat-containing serine protease family protein [Planctomycetota bacterium]